MGLSRRDFIKSSAVASGVLVLDLSGCSGGDVQTAPPADPPGDPPVDEPTPDVADVDPPVAPDPSAVLMGLYASSAIPKAEDAVTQALKQVDFGWLKEGDSVFVKLACNSGNEHPAVTSPAAVTALCAALFEHGAGKVIVGDQAGVEGVRLVEGEERFGSTKAFTEQNGLLAAITAAGAEPHFFDDQGYAAGYFEATPPEGDHWAEPMMVPNVVKEVDHIVYLPRLSSHILAGYTHGLKVSMGWLRDDSRFHVHHDAASLHEKYTEINYCTEIRDRLRLVLTFAESLLLDMGPDDGTIAVADPRIVIASADLANHDALTAAVLAHIDEITPKDPGVAFTYGDNANTFNSLFLSSLVQGATGLPWGSGSDGYTALVAHKYWDGIDADRALSRAYEITGGVPEQITVRLSGAALEPDLKTAIEAYSGGVFNLTTEETDA